MNKSKHLSTPYYIVIVSKNMGYRCFVCIIAFLISILLPGHLSAEDGNHRILVLFKASEGFNESTNPFRLLGHNHYDTTTYKFDYHNIEASFPGQDDMMQYAAVITWYTSPRMKNPEIYLEWLVSQIFQKRKVIIIGNYGAYTQDGEVWLKEDVLNRFYLLFGLEFKSQWTNDQALLDLSFMDQDLAKANLKDREYQVNNYYRFNSVHAKNQSYCIIKRKDIPGSESHIVVKTPFGGMALYDYVTTTVDGQSHTLLDILPFVDACLEQALDPGDLPQHRVLGLLKQSEDSSAYTSYVHRFVFRELFSLGYWTDYHFVEQSLPDHQEMNSYDGVISWYRTPDMKNGEDYIPWLLEQIVSDRKVIIIGNFGAFKAIKNEETKELGAYQVDWWVDNLQVNNFFNPFGLQFLGNWSGDPEILKVDHIDSSMMEYEIPLMDSDVKHYYQWKSVNPENELFLKVSRTDKANSESAFTVRTPYGGMVFEGYLMKWDSTENRLKFRLNIREFLKQCLSYTPASAPEPINLLTHEELIHTDDSLGFCTYEKEVPREEIPSGAKEMKRWILILYDGAETGNSDLEVQSIPIGIVLNHLGLLVKYWDIQKGLPDEINMSKYLGIISWFFNPLMKQPARYAEWINQQITQGRKMIIIGNYGAYMDASTKIGTKDFKKVFHAMGLRHWDTELSPSMNQRVLYKSPEMMDFETELKLDGTSLCTKKITSESPENKVFLSIEDKNLGVIDAVVVTPVGGLIMDDIAIKWTIKDKQEINRIREYIQSGGQTPTPFEESTGFNSWQINPFLFFREALDLENQLIPDVTTMNGSRIFYSHIDGDGFTGISLIDRASYSSEFVRDQIFKHYPLPFTVSVISGEIEDNGLSYYNKGYDIAKEIYTLPNIEAATHSYSHPFNWRVGNLEIKRENNIWTHDFIELDLDKEILSSVRFINQNLLPEDKDVEVLLWSGLCNPDERALEYLEKICLPNLNGGDPIFDSNYPSYTSLAPFARNIGKYWQYYTSSSNDYIYTKGWTENHGNMKKLIDHYKHTESPRRILPLNAYFHFYIGDRQVGLDGLKEALDYCMNTRIAPMFASDYVSVAKDFTELRQFFLQDSSYLILHNGSLRTLRIDNSHPSGFPDLSRSKGVLGYLSYQNSLYIHLDESTVQQIYLQDTKPREVYLKVGSHRISEWKSTKDSVSFMTIGTGKAEFEVSNLHPLTTYSVVLIQEENNQTVLEETLETDEDGDLILYGRLPGYRGRYRAYISRNRIH